MIESIKHKLEKSFCPSHLEVTDDSFKHRHHKEAKTHGGGHYSLVVVSEKFNDMPLMARHRAIYAALATDMQHIHALAIKAHTPTEWQNKA